jgi:hypothetical protein
MTLRRSIVAVFVLGVTALPSAAIGFSDYGDRLRNQFERVRVEGQADPAAGKLVKLAVKTIGSMENPKLEASYAAELRGMSKVAKSVEKSLPGDALLNARLANLVDLYAADIEAARADLAADAGGGDTAAAKALSKVEKALAKVTPEMPASGKLKGYAKAAKALGARFVPGTTERDAAYVISGATVTAPAGSFDFDGDLSPDNALEAVDLHLDGAGFDLQAALEGAVEDRPTYALLWLWAIESFDTDPEVWFGFANGQDEDGNPLDNFLGYEVFRLTQAPSPIDGFPQRRGPSPVASGGQFDVAMTGESFEFAGFTVPLEVPALLRGTMTSGSVTGVLGLAIPAVAFVDWLETLGMPSGERDTVLALADLDLDPEPGNDAFSCAFTITAVPAEVILP